MAAAPAPPTFTATDFTSMNSGDGAWIKLTGDASKGQYLAFKADNVSFFQINGKTVTVHFGPKIVNIALESEDYALNLGSCIMPNFNL